FAPNRKPHCHGGHTSSTLTALHPPASTGTTRKRKIKRPSVTNQTNLPASSPGGHGTSTAHKDQSEWGLGCAFVCVCGRMKSEIMVTVCHSTIQHTYFRVRMHHSVGFII
uniref:Uncharacterized protein n=1 Tax=Anopheles coluzzii TaxID=1518534 RepID=A0A6E8W2L4_ANOCL